MSVRTLVKSIQNIMRKDTGVDGDAQRISQLCWMFFLEIIDDQDTNIGFRAARDPRGLLREHQSSEPET